MTDTPEEHARLSERAPRAKPLAPAAHTHPQRPAAAVMEARPPQMPPAFGWPSPQRAAGPGDPPAFGFNAPGGLEETEATLAGASAAPAAAATPVPVAEPPAAAPAGPLPSGLERPFTIPTRPPSSSLAPATAQPRELMPAQLAVERRRLGASVTPTFGPPGRRRSPAAMAVFSVLTLGVYAIAWHRRANQEMGDFDPRIHVHPSRSAWAVFLPWFAGLLASAAATGIVLAQHYGLDLHLNVTGRQVLPAVAALAAVPYLILFLPFSVLAVSRTAERVRTVEEHAGITTDEQIRPAAVVGWLVMPIIGGMVLMGRQQRHLNRIWDLARE